MSTATEFEGPTCRKDSCFEIHHAKTDDGLPLTIYRARDTAGLPALVFANALGAPAEVIEPFADFARRRVAVITWDPRCMPGPGVADFAKITPADHGRDLLRVMDLFELRAASVAGWCTGAETALEAARIAPHRVVQAILLNGDYSFASQKNGERGELTKQLFKELIGNPDDLDFYFSCVGGGKPSAEAAGSDDLSGNEDARLLDLVSRAGKQDPEKLYRFAVMSNNFWENRIESWIDQVRCRCVALGTDNDVVAHADSTRRIAELLPNCSGEILAGKSHFSICYDEDLFERVISLVLAARGDDRPV